MGLESYLLSPPCFWIHEASSLVSLVSSYLPLQVVQQHGRIYFSRYIPFFIFPWSTCLSFLILSIFEGRDQPCTFFWENPILSCSLQKMCGWVVECRTLLLEGCTISCLIWKSYLGYHHILYSVCLKNPTANTESMPELKVGFLFWFP